jgi:hypothetical protein
LRTAKAPSHNRADLLVDTQAAGNGRDPNMQLSRNCSHLLRFPLHDFEIKDCNAVEDRYKQQRDEGGNRQPANLCITKGNNYVDKSM